VYRRFPIFMVPNCLSADILTATGTLGHGEGSSEKVEADGDR
jgi:Ni,Fe-hydrogenase III small subunit